MAVMAVSVMREERENRCKVCCDEIFLAISLLLHRCQHNDWNFARSLMSIIIKGRHHLNHLIV